MPGPLEDEPVPEDAEDELDALLDEALPDDVLDDEALDTGLLDEDDDELELLAEVVGDELLLELSFVAEPVLVPQAASPTANAAVVTAILSVFIDVFPSKSPGAVFAL